MTDLGLSAGHIRSPGIAKPAAWWRFALGRVAAGAPVEAVEQVQRNELLELLTLPGRYLLRVGDDSMCESGILAGDFVVVQSQQRAGNGDIVLALIDGEQLALKRIRLQPGNLLQLLSDDPDAKSLLVDAARVDIQGRIVGQLRRYR